MEKEELIAFLKEHLSIEVETETDYYNGGRSSIRVILTLGTEEITSSSTSLPS